MLGGGVSRGQARPRPYTSNGHPPHMLSFNPLSTACRNANPNIIGSGSATMDITGLSTAPTSLSASSSRSIDLSKRAASGEVNVDFGLNGGNEGDHNGSTEILPMLLQTPKLSFLPEGKVPSCESRRRTRKSESKEYIAACSSNGIREIKGSALPELCGRASDEIPVLDESKCNGSIRPLPNPITEIPMDMEVVRPSSPSGDHVVQQKNKNKKNVGVVLRPLRKPQQPGSPMSMTSSDDNAEEEDEDEEEERKESGDTTDSECDSSSSRVIKLKRNICSGTGSLPGRSGRCGLKNLGNTCYMNSSLQCLSNIPSFREFFLRKEHLHQLNPSRGAAKGELAKAFGSLLTELWLGRGGSGSTSSTSVKPTKVKQLIGKVASRFSGYQQHDAQEFLLFFLDALHDDLNRVIQDVPFEELHDIPGEKPLAKSQRCWENYVERNDSHVVDTFCGQLHSEIVCQECGKRSDVFEPFMDLSTPIPEIPQAGGNGVVSVQDCLDAFTKTEVLSGLEAVYCSQCKDHRDSRKTIRVQRLPKVLVIHLKRFSSHRKLAKAVDIPVDALDMRPYLSESSPHGDGGEGEGGEVPATMTRNQQTYKLIGAVNHMGSFHGGHYTADCLHSPSQEWLKLNDSIVTTIKADQIDNEDAYLLIYQQVEPLHQEEEEEEEEEEEHDQKRSHL